MTKLLDSSNSDDNSISGSNNDGDKDHDSDTDSDSKSSSSGSNNKGYESMAPTGVVLDGDRLMEDYELRTSRFLAGSKQLRAATVPRGLTGAGPRSTAQQGFRFCP